MKTFVIATLGMAIATSVLAQGVPSPADPNTSRPANAQNVQRAVEAQQLFSEYLGKHRNRGMEARKVLDVVTINGLPPSAANVKAIRDYLNDEKIDPRKIMAFLISNEGKQLIASLAQPQLFEKARSSIALYSKQYPQNSMMREAVEDITTTIENSKR